MEMKYQTVSQSNETALQKKLMVGELEAFLKPC